MALGGGTWTSQNKTLPGSYVNFVSIAKADASLSDRGVVAMPLTLNWGETDKVITVDGEDFRNYAQNIFGYHSGAPELRDVSEIFLHATKLHFYRVIGSNAEKASNAYAEALFPGTRGNDLKIVIQSNADESEKYDVMTYLGSRLVDIQTVSKSEDLKANSFVSFKSEKLTSVPGAALTGGTNGDSPTVQDYQKALNAFEAYHFNVLGCPVTDDSIIKLFAAYTKRMRNEVGSKFQTVVYNYEKADTEGVISVVTSAKEAAHGLVFWVSGAQAGCGVAESLTNRLYDGSYTVDASMTQVELSKAIKAGKFAFHLVNDEVRVLEDINTFVSYSDEKNADFSSNQTIRVLDQIANDTAAMFSTRYLGKVPNDASGRISLWNEICKIYQSLEAVRAIEGFTADDVTILPGETKKSVICTCKAVNVINAMSKLYVSVIVQ